MFHRYRSTESAEKKLPKPLYIFLSILSFLIISLLGFGFVKIFELLSVYADEVLKLYTW